MERKGFIGNAMVWIGLEGISFMSDTEKMERFPFDYDSLTYGSYITPEEIERACGTDRAKDFRTYQLKAMNVKEQILRELLQRTGIVYTAKQEKDGIRILNPDEASEYNHGRIQCAVRQLVVAHHRNLSVDVSDFTDDQIKDHTRRIECDSKLISAINQARKTPKLQATKRVVPASIGTALTPN